jgi:hypothetical protein
MKVSRGSGSLSKASTILASLWIVVCIVFFGVEAAFYDDPSYPSGLKSFFTANYLE